MLKQFIIVNLRWHTLNIMLRWATVLLLHIAFTVGAICLKGAGVFSKGGKELAPLE